MYKKYLSAMLFLVCLLSIPATASARIRSGYGFAARRTVVMHPYPYWGWGWGTPFWWDYYPYYYPADSRGTVKIKDGNKLDMVYLNGAYAGTVDKMKSIQLDPGQYRIQVKHEQKELIDRQVYVVAGKTVEVRVTPNTGG